MPFLATIFTYLYIIYIKEDNNDNQRVMQNKITQRDNHDICVPQEYFYTKFSSFIQYIFLHNSV